MKNSLIPWNNNLIESINIDLFNWELTEIIEVTYAYAKLDNWKSVNKTLFWDLIWNSPDKDLSKDEEKKFWEQIRNNIELAYTQTLWTLENKKKLVDKYRKEIHKSNLASSPRIKILLWSLDYLDNILDLTITGLPFEARKAWMNINLSEEEKISKIEKLEEIETKLFWWNVRENKREVQWSYEVLKNLFEKQKTKLSPEEQTRFSNYLSILKEKFSYIDETKIKNEKDLEVPDILNREIQREDYVKILQIALDIYWLDIPVIIEERNSIYDWDDYLGIPNSEWYQTLPLWRILQLISHEIETHYVILKNNKKSLWNFRWWWNLKREEWAAKVAEWILKWRTLNDFWIWWAIPDLLMWEILTWDEYKDYLHLFSKMDKSNMTFWVALWDPEWLFLRRKRNYPLDYKWVQHKDTSYNRGEQAVVKFIKSWWNPLDLYVGKVSFEDINNAKEIVNEENPKLMYPLLLGEIILYVVNWNKLVGKNFWKYIESKYPFINVEKYIENGTIEKLSFTNKKKILEILNLVK